MNERIRLLAIQANVLHTDFFDNEWEVEKFAELIVKECLTIMQDANQSKLRLSDAIWNTKIHFGVE